MAKNGAQAKPYRHGDVEAIFEDVVAGLMSPEDSLKILVVRMHPGFAGTSRYRQ